MPRAQADKPKTFQEFVEIIEQRQNAAGHPLWYRGVSRLSYALEPSLYRPSHIKSAAHVTAMEKTLITQFGQRSLPYLSSPQSVEKEWDMTFFMQHYRVPTRLLDWTENPFIALYFAVMNANLNLSTQRYDQAAVVWVLDPIEWNKYALRRISHSGYILTPNDTELSAYKPTTVAQDQDQKPLAIYGAHNSPRIVAQKGAFTVFGSELKDMEKTFIDDGFPGGCLARVVLNPSVINSLKTSILSFGITESTVFPDLDGLAAELRRINNFGE